MSMELHPHQNEGTGVVAYLTSATTLSPHQQVVVGDTTGGAFTVTLPPAAVCAGKIFTFSIGAGTNAMTLVFTGDKAALTNHTTLDAANDRVSYYCDGLYWLQLSSTIA